MGVQEKGQTRGLFEPLDLMMDFDGDFGFSMGSSIAGSSIG